MALDNLRIPPCSDHMAAAAPTLTRSTRAQRWLAAGPLRHVSPRAAIQVSPAVSGASRNSPAPGAAAGVGGRLRGRRACARGSNHAQTLQAPRTGAAGSCRRPVGVPVSMLSVNDRKPIRCCSSWAIVSIRCRSDRPRRSSLQTTSVSPATVVEAAVELGAVAQCARRGVGERPLAPGLAERVQLKRDVLAAGRHARVADQSHRTADRPRTLGCARNGTIGFETAFRDGQRSENRGGRCRGLRRPEFGRFRRTALVLAKLSASYKRAFRVTNRPQLV
jgi:hypothetical protein